MCQCSGRHVARRILGSCGQGNLLAHLSGVLHQGCFARQMYLLIPIKCQPWCQYIYATRKQTSLATGVYPFGKDWTSHLPSCGNSRISSAARPQGSGPLFQFQDGCPLSKEKLLFHLHETLRARGLDTVGLTGHSFRVGATTAAACAGLEDSVIQALGRWRSDAYFRYIRTPGCVLAAFSSHLLPPLWLELVMNLTPMMLSTGTG